MPERVLTGDLVVFLGLCGRFVGDRTFGLLFWLPRPGEVASSDAAFCLSRSERDRV